MNLIAPKSSSPKRSLHIFDSIQSIFQSNNQHNHSFNHRHHAHDKGNKHKHNHNIDKTEHQSNKTKPNTSQIKCNDSHKLKAKAKEDTVVATAVTSAIATTAEQMTTNECDDDAVGQLESNPTSPATVTGVSSKLQNVTRILINSTNPQRQPNGKYKNTYMRAN